MTNWNQASFATQQTMLLSQSWKITSHIGALNEKDIEMEIEVSGVTVCNEICQCTDSKKML